MCIIIAKLDIITIHYRQNRAFLLISTLFHQNNMQSQTPTPSHIIILAHKYAVHDCSLQ